MKNHINYYTGVKKIILTMFLIIAMFMSTFSADCFALELDDGIGSGQAAVSAAGAVSTGYTIQTVDGRTASTVAEGQPKVLFFYMTTCSNCSSMLRNLQNNGRINGIDIIVSDMENASLSSVNSYIAPYSMDYVTWCYGSQARSAAWMFVRESGLGNHITTPLVVYLDKDNNIVKITTGYISDFASEIKAVLCSDGSCDISQPEGAEISGSGNNSGKAVSAASSEIKVKLNGKTLDFDVPPQIINGRTMVPMRKIFESLGLNVSWSSTSRIATASNGHATIMMEPGCGYMLVNCNDYPLDTPAVIINGRNLVPVRAIAESMWCQVSWDEASRTVFIESSEYEPDDTCTQDILSRSDSEILTYENRAIGHKYGFLYGLSAGAVLEEDWSGAIYYNGEYLVPVKNATSMLDVQKEWNIHMPYFIPVPDKYFSKYRVLNGKLYSTNMGIGDDILQGKIELTGIVKRSGDTIELSGCSWRSDEPDGEYKPNYFTYMLKAKADGWYCTSITGKSGIPWNFN